MPAIYLLLWGYLSAAVALGWWYRPGTEHLMAIPMVVAAVLLLLAAVWREPRVAAAGLIVLSAAMVSRSVSIMFADDLEWSSKWLAVNVWLVIAMWAMLRVRTVARYGVQEWGRDP
jgi:hypothetical protein